MNNLSNEKLEQAIRMLHLERFSYALSIEEACRLYEETTPVHVSPDFIRSLVKFATDRPLNEPEKTTRRAGEWVRSLPVKAMKKLNFSLPAGVGDLEAILSFFDAEDEAQIDDRFESAAVAYRQASSSKVNQYAVAAWIREAELVAEMIPKHPYDESLLRTSIGEMRKLTRLRVEDALTQMQNLCASAGLAFVMVPELPATRISGCARWLEDGRPMIGLTVRYKTDDQLWFTFFHELGHILLHREHLSFVLDNSEQVAEGEVDSAMSQIEAEANEFARDMLIEPDQFADFVAEGIFTNDSVRAFSELIGIAPGIVVGRLQREKLIEYHQGNAFKQKIEMQPDFGDER